jgi:hypothetical protein
MRRRRILGAVCLLLVAGPAPWVAAAEVAAVALAAGAYDTGDPDEGTGEAGVEWRGAGWWRERLAPRLALRPILGASVTTDRAAWGYAGLLADWRVAPRWLLAPSFAVSLFDPGDGKELGGPVEFRSAIEAAYEVGPRLRLGLAFYHLSNAGLYDDNPGSNSLVLVLATSWARR